MRLKILYTRCCFGLRLSVLNYHVQIGYVFVGITILFCQHVGLLLTSIDSLLLIEFCLILFNICYIVFV